MTAWGDKVRAAPFVLGGEWLHITDPFVPVEIGDRYVRAGADSVWDISGGVLSGNHVEAGLTVGWVHDREYLVYRRAGVPLEDPPRPVARSRGNDQFSVPLPLP